MMTARTGEIDGDGVSDGRIGEKSVALAVSVSTPNSSPSPSPGPVLDPHICIIPWTVVRQQI